MRIADCVATAVTSAVERMAPGNAFTRSDGVLDGGWLGDVISGRRRPQTVAVGVNLDPDVRVFGVERFKGLLRVDVGLFFVEFGG